MSSDTPVVDRTALVQTLYDAHVYRLHLGGERIREQVADDIIAAGILRDADEVRRKAWDECIAAVIKLAEAYDAEPSLIYALRLVGRDAS